MNYLNEMEYLSQEMKMQKNIMMQSDKDLLRKTNLRKRKSYAIKKIKELEEKKNNMKSN